MCRVREINEIGQLEDLAPAWSELLPTTPGGTFFHSLEWLRVYWAHFGAGQRLRVLIVEEEDGRVIGILPLVVRPSRRRLMTVQVLTYPLDHWGSFYGPIGPDPARTLKFGLAHIRRTPRDWQLLELPWVDAQGADGGATQTALADANLSASAEPCQTSALVQLDTAGSWEQYWASRDSRWRNNVRRSEKKLAQRGKVTYLRYRPAAGEANPRWDLYHTCERIASASWQAGSTTGTTLVHDDVREFLRQSHAVAANRGALDVNLLLIDSQPVAFNYAYHFRGNVFGLRTGFVADDANAGAGTVLQARMIADSFARGDRLYDLGPGYLDCKRYWLTEARTSARYTHFATGDAVAQMLHAQRRIRRWWQGSDELLPATIERKGA